MKNAKHRNPKFSPQLESMDTRVVPSVIGFGPGFRARIAMARQAFRNVGAVPASRFMLQGNTRLNPLSVQAANNSPNGRRVAVPTMFGVSPFSRQAARLNLPTPPAQSAPRVILTSTAPPQLAAVQTSAASQIGDVKNGPLAKAGADLIAIYQAFGPSGSGSLSSGSAASIERVGNSVGVEIRGSGDVNALVATMTDLGMQIRATDSTTRAVAGLLPIAQLPNVVQLSQVSSIIPIYAPKLN